MGWCSMLVVEIGHVASRIAPEPIIVGPREDQGDFFAAMAVLGHRRSGCNAHEKQLAADFAGIRKSYMASPGPWSSRELGKPLTGQANGRAVRGSRPWTRGPFGKAMKCCGSSMLKVLLAAFFGYRLRLKLAEQRTSQQGSAARMASAAGGAPIRDGCHDDIERLVERAGRVGQQWWPHPNDDQCSIGLPPASSADGHRPGACAT